MSMQLEEHTALVRQIVTLGKEIERVRQREADPMLPALRHAAENHAGQQIAKTRRAERDNHARAE